MAIYKTLASVTHPAAKMSESRYTTIRLHDIAIALQRINTGDLQVLLKEAVAKRLHLATADLQHDAKIIRRALDMRQKQGAYQYVVDINVETSHAYRLLKTGKASKPHQPVRYRFVCERPWSGNRPVVVGAGPAGLFAALTLAKAGMPPILIDRGKMVEERARDVSKLYAHGILNPESNVCFGEGGAGTFSDGKLYTRVGDAHVDCVLEQLVALGANPDILIHNRPHLGTDKLIVLLRNMRQHLLQLGVILQYNTSVEDFDIATQSMRGLRLAGGSYLEADNVILATGHSARHIWERLHALELPLESRPFAVGFRVEHPQAMINQARYGGAAATCNLPAADYRLVYNDQTPNKRAVYSFCMCPGGVVVTTPTKQDALCINGMSHASRKGRFANSALVVTVDQADFAQAGFEGIFAGVNFQEAIEQQAFALGGGNFTAPASRLADFVENRVSKDVGASSYRRGLSAADLTTLYPAQITSALRTALKQFNHTIPDFITNEATLIGVETRTASPIRLQRDATSMQTVGLRGLYPCGEGLGYGGGIVSAAVDGMCAAESLLLQSGARRIQY